MIVLKKIIGINYHKSCFCGRQLIGNLCEIHGSDIKVSMKLIHAQFEINYDNKANTVNVSLTENQFINLFKAKQLQDLANYSEKYKVKLSSYGSDRDLEEILSEFFEYVEYDYFLEKKRIKELPVTNSGIMIHYLFNSKMLTDNSLEVDFELVITRSIKDYIKWRIQHFKSTPEAVSKSLINTRSDVITKDNRYCKIIDLQWDENKSILSSVKINCSQNENTTINLKPKELFHDQNHYFFSPRMENKMHSALHNFAQKFMKSFKQFLQQQSYLAEISRLKENKDSSYYSKFIGKNISVSLEKFDEQIKKSNELELQQKNGI